MKLKLISRIEAVSVRNWIYKMYDSMSTIIDETCVDSPLIISKAILLRDMILTQMFDVFKLV